MQECIGNVLGNVHLGREQHKYAVLNETAHLYRNGSHIPTRARGARHSIFSLVCIAALFTV